MVPWLFNANNALTLAQYAARYQPLGGLMSIWECSSRFMYEGYATIAFAGKLWNSGESDQAEALRQEALVEVLPSVGPLTRQLVAVETGRQMLRLGPSVNAYLNGPLTADERERAEINRAIGAALGSETGATPEEQLILEDLSARIAEEKLHLTLRELTTGVYWRLNRREAGTVEALLPAIAAAREEATRIRATRLQQWDTSRPGLDRAPMTRYLEGPLAVLEQLEQTATGREPNTGLLRIALCLPHHIALQSLQIFLLYEGDADWTLVDQGVYKPHRLRGSAYYDIWRPIDATRPITACRLVSWGFGGLGIVHIEAVNQSGHYTPTEIVARTGQVDRPEWILVDDRLVCSVGEKDSDIGFYDVAQSRIKHGMDVGMADVNSTS